MDLEELVMSGRLETFGMQPQSLTVAKALSSSYLPISAVILSDEIYTPIAEKSGELGIFGHGHTYIWSFILSHVQLL